MKLEIISLQKRYFAGEVDKITLPGVLGSFQILKNHAPLISSLASGKLVFSADGDSMEIKINGGFVEVNNNKVTVCIDAI